jgi:hypothetical protein
MNKIKKLWKWLFGTRKQQCNIYDVVRCLSVEQYDFLKDVMGFKKETIDSVLVSKDRDYFDDFSKNIDRLIELHKSLMFKISK